MRKKHSAASPAAPNINPLASRPADADSQKAPSLQRQNAALRQELVELGTALAHYRDLYEFAPVGYLTLSSQGDIIAINQTGASLLDEDRSTLQHSDFARFIAPEDQDRWYALISRTPQNHEKRRCEFNLQRRDHSAFHARLDCVPSHEDQSGDAGFRITITDTTEVHHTRRALIESEERFRAFMTHSPVASWIVDTEGCYQYASPIYYRMFQVPTANLAGKHIGDIYPAELARQYLQSNQQALSAEKPVETIQTGVHSDGSAGEFLVVKFPIRDASGKPLLCGMALDITEHRQAIAQLRTANHRLENLAAEQAKHLREIASELTCTEQRERDRLQELLHDNMQPLLVAARLSLCGLHAETPASDCLRVSAQACAHISKVLQVARTLSQQLSPPLIRERGLNPALESLCHWVHTNHMLSVHMEATPEAEPEDVATRLLCFNAVRELLMNVVKHAGTKQASLKLELADHHTLRITVTDHGIGFDPELLTRGTGLPAIRRRLGMLGGCLRIESQPGQGSAAILTAPLHTPEIPAGTQ